MNAGVSQKQAEVLIAQSAYRTFDLLDSSGRLVAWVRCRSIKGRYLEMTIIGQDDKVFSLAMANLWVNQTAGYIQIVEAAYEENL